MTISADILLDRIKLKTKLNFWRFITIIVSFASIAMITKNNSGSNNMPVKDYIARIKVEEIILENSKRVTALDNISKNKSIKAVILHINSPGGTLVGSEDIFYTLREISKNKPVVAIMGTMAASGGYMSALGADYIFAHDATITGSIGVILQSVDVSGLAKKMGINLLTYKSGKYKAVPSPMETPDADINKVINETIMDNYDIFVEMVADRRKLDKQEVLKLADGRIYTGRQAVSNKLIDAIGNEKDAIDWLKREKQINDQLAIKDIELIEEENIIKKYLPKTSIFDNTRLSINNVNGILAIWNM